MSYDDTGRNDNGQFYGGVGMIGEQAIAGVGWNDNAMTAMFKVQNMRESYGLDPLTGAPKPVANPLVPGSGGGSGWVSKSARVERDEGQILQILGHLVMWVVVWPALIALAIGTTLYGAKTIDGPSLATRAASTEFASYKLTAPSAFLPAKDLATPIDPKALLAEFHAPLPSKKADPKRLHSQNLLAKAYHCVMQPGCRADMAKLDAVAADNLPYVAAGFFVPLIAKGDERAARDMCMLPLMAGATYRDMLVTRTTCAQAMHANSKSWAARAALDKLEGSWSMSLAKAYGFINGLVSGLLK